MNIKSILVLCFIGFASNAAEVSTTDIKQSVAKNSSSLKQVEVCDSTIEFIKAPKVKQQELKLNETVSLTLKQYLSSYNSRFGTSVATNIICQTLTGANYTGSEEEWVQFIKQASQGMEKSGGKNMRLVLVGEKDKVYQGTESNKEYKFYGTFKGISQAIHNVAILDKPKNTVYIISVSGADKGETAIKEEFKRAIDSFLLNKESK